MESVLGISLGTRSLGVAIIENGELADYKVQCFFNAWSHKKLKSIVQGIIEIAEQNHVTAIAIKIPDTLPISKGFMQLVGTINLTFKRKKVSIFYFPLSDLKQHFCKTTKADKGCLMECLLRYYPKLAVEHKKEQRNCKPYYDKLFEAVAAARHLQDMHS